MTGTATGAERLLDGFELRDRPLRNRVVFGPHETNLSYRRSISRRHLAYYFRRARGGVGLIVIENASVHRFDWPYERAPLAAECADGWRRVGAVCREEGAVVLAGLSHAGSQGSSAYSQRELWAPSSVPDVASREVPKEMEPEDITEVVAGFAAAARLAADAGLDGVEINGGQHSLVRQFLSGLTNLRDDEYGDRLRFARDVLTAVRAAMPAGILGLRLSCDELAPWAGITPEQATTVATSLAGYLDYLAVVRGSAMAAAATRPDGHTPPGFNLDLTRDVRKALQHAGHDRVAVVAQGSIVDVGQAGRAVGDAADLVEMTRALIADANLPRKVADGEADRVRPCILCNQACMVRDVRNPLVSCVADPRTGHEWDEPTVMSVPPARRRVVVVGGGPAGLEAARVAADARPLGAPARAARSLRRGGARRGRRRGPRAACAAGRLAGERVPATGRAAPTRHPGRSRTAERRRRRRDPGHRVGGRTPHLRGRRRVASPGAADRTADGASGAAAVRARRSCPPATSCTRCGRARRPAWRRAPSSSGTRSAARSGSAWPRPWRARGER